MIAVKDSETLRFVLFNRTGEELTGINRNTLIGKSDFDIFPRDQADHFTREDRKVLESGKLHTIPEEPITTRHNGVRLLRTLKMPVLDATGKPRYLPAMSYDITARKRAEAALHETEALFGSIMSVSSDAVMAVDDDGLIVIANERFQSLFGYRPDERIGRHSSMLAAPDTYNDAIERIRNALANATLGGPEVVPNLVGQRKDGTTFPAEASLSEHVSAERGHL